MHFSKKKNYTSTYILMGLTKTSEQRDNCKEVKVLHVLEKVTSVFLDLVEHFFRNFCLCWMNHILQKIS